MRQSQEIHRKTKETDIRLRLDLDDPARQEVATGHGFFDHMLASFAKHGRLGLALAARGDDTGPHHLVEDVGIVLGQALDQALGDKRGIERYGHAALPMDDVLVEAAVDLGGRGYLVFKAPEIAEGETGLGIHLVRDFFYALAIHGRLNLHLRVAEGTNPHHVIEALFKATAVALRRAAQQTGGTDLPTTKGVI